MKKDSDIIRRIVNGDKEAFSILYKTYSEKVYSTALSFTKNVEDAEEVTQDVFVKIHNKAHSFKGGSSLSTWIYRVTINTSLNHIKKKNRFTFFKNSNAHTPSIEFHHPGILLENKESATILFRAIDYLPDSQKTAFILSYIEDLPRQEVANIMNNTLKSVESLLQRAKNNLRVKLGNMYPQRRKSKNELSK